MEQFSKRTNWETAPNDLARLARSILETGQNIIDLTGSNPTHSEFRYLDAGLLKPFTDTGNLSYDPSPRGLLTARASICDYYRRHGISVTPEQVFLTAGTSEAYGFLFRLLAEPGEMVLAPRPSYPLLDYLAGLADIQVERYPLIYQNKWKIDKSRFQAGSLRKPKAVVVVNPNNPTGNFVSPKEREAINRFARVQQAAVISDEVFLDFAHPARPDMPSFAHNREVLTLTLSGVSKAAGLPQMKLSWIVVSGPPDLCEEAGRRLEVISDTFLSVSIPAQRALPFWLGKQREITGEILDRLNVNKTCLAQAVSGIERVKLLACEGGWYAVLEVAGDRTDEEWAVLLLQEDRVLVHPGYLFDFEGGPFLVLSLLPPPDLFSKGVDRFAKRLKKPI